MKIAAIPVHYTQNKYTFRKTLKISGIVKHLDAQKGFYWSQKICRSNGRIDF